MFLKFNGHIYHPDTFLVFFLGKFHNQYQRMLIEKHFCRDHGHSKLFCCTLDKISLMTLHQATVIKKCSIIDVSFKCINITDKFK